MKNHIILYDDECPMCDLYTRAFIKTNMLDKNGREPFSTIPDHLRQYIDQERACDEIALVDTRTGRVKYGIDSLFAILGNRYTFLRPLFASRIFRRMMQYPYSFISYNRKVIVPGKVFETKGSCTPRFNLPYRWAYLLFAWIITSIILNAYSHLLADYVPAGDFWREFLICGGQIAFQSIIIALLGKERLMHYLGNMMTISLAGSLLLVPAIILHNTALISGSSFYLAWFATVVTLMFLEHARRVKHLGIHWSATAGWVAYRTLVLLTLIP